MNTLTVGLLTIGQAPRPDLTAPLRRMWPTGNFLEAGALDDLAPGDLPSRPQGPYPLMTRLRTGERVVVDEEYLAPRVQRTLDALEAQGVAASLLLCAGSFAGVHGAQPLFKPFELACAVLHSLSVRQIAVLCPVPEQETPIRQRWEEAGFAPAVWTAALDMDDPAFARAVIRWVGELRGASCLVLDYVGHPMDQARRLQDALPIPVVDLGLMAMAALVSTVRPTGARVESRKETVERLPDS